MGRTTTKTLPAGMAGIETLTEVFAKRRASVHALVLRLNQELEVVKTRRLPALKAAVAEAKDAQAALEAAVEANRDEFVKPKTRSFHGIKVGLRKLVGSLSWDDSNQVVKLIEKLFPDQADVLIKTEKKPVKDALAQLPGADLKRLGVSVEEDSDVVFIKPTDSEVDKFVDALLAERSET